MKRLIDLRGAAARAALTLILFLCVWAFGQNEHRPVTSPDARQLENELRRVWFWLGHWDVKKDVPTRLRDATEGQHFLYVDGDDARIYFFANGEWKHIQIAKQGIEEVLAGTDTTYLTIADTSWLATEWWVTHLNYLPRVDVGDSITTYITNKQDDSDTTTWDATAYDLITGLALKLDKTAFDDSVAANDIVVKADSVLLFATQYDIAGLGGGSGGGAFVGNVKMLQPGDAIEDSLEALTGTITEPWLVLLAPGIYTVTGTITPTGYITVAGIDPEPTHTVIQILKTNLNVFRFQGYNWCLKNLTIKKTQASATSSSVIRANYTETNAPPGAFVIDNCVVVDSSGSSVSPTISIEASQGVNSIIKNSKIVNLMGTGDYGYGIEINWSSTPNLYTADKYRFTVDNCIIDNFDNGIRYSSGAYVHAYITNNYILNSDYGIRVVSNSTTLSQNIHFSNNLFRNNEDDISYYCISNRLINIWDDNIAGNRDVSGLTGSNYTLFYKNAYTRFFLTTSTLTPALTQNVWTKVTGFDTKDGYGFYVAGDSTKAFSPGLYNVTGTFTLSGASGDVYDIQLMIGGDLDTQLKTSITLDGTGNTATSFSGIVNIAANDWLSLWVRNTANDNDATFTTCNFSAIKIISD